MPLPEAPAHDALAEADGAGPVELARNDSTPAAEVSAEIENAESLPEAGPAAILPDSDVL